MRILCAVLALFLIASRGSATVWRVERDGSGDFAVIQAAVDVAASGDTILVGAGRYDDKQLFGNPPWQQYVRILAVKPELTIIGAGATLTIVGPALPWTDVQDEDKGIYITGDGQAAPPSLCVRGMRFENSGIGIHAETSAGTIRVHDCEFRGNTTSIASFCRSTEVTECRFLSLADSWGYHVNAIGQDSLRISSSVFELESQPSHIKVLLNAQSTVLATIADSEFRGGRLGASVSNGTRAEFRNCLFDGQGLYGVAVNVADVLMEDSVIRNQSSALFMTGPGGLWMLDRVSFANVRDATLEYGNLGGGYIRNCTLAKGSRFVVWDVNMYPVDGPTPITLDMANNWWGTSDPDSIRAWVYDSSDQPTRPYYYVQWNPYRSEPLAAQGKNLGDVKALYR